MIYFLAPDDPRPWGGIKMIYEYVSVLQSCDISACVWHGTPGFRCTWFRSEAPVVNALELTLEQGDVLVVPEVLSHQWKVLCAGAPTIVLNQNHFNTFGGVTSSDPERSPYPGSPETVGVIATSQAIHALVRAVTPETLPVHQIPVVLDLDLFSPLPKERLISWMPRKRERQVTVVLQALWQRGKLDGWTFQPIDQMTAEETADILGRSAVFLLGGEDEGLGLPGIEAMACGAYVIGFPGGGGAEYANAPLCTPIDDGDVLTMVESVEAAARTFELDPDDGRERTELTRNWLTSKYGRDVVSESWRQTAAELMAPGSPSRIEHPVAVRHLEVAAISERANEASLRRRMGRRLRAAGFRG